MECMKRNLFLIDLLNIVTLYINDNFYFETVRLEWNFIY